MSNESFLNLPFNYTGQQKNKICPCSLPKQSTPTTYMVRNQNMTPEHFYQLPMSRNGTYESFYCQIPYRPTFVELLPTISSVCFFFRSTSGGISCHIPTIASKHRCVLLLQYLLSIVELSWCDSHTHHALYHNCQGRSQDLNKNEYFQPRIAT